MIYWKEENFKGARYHYLRSDDSKNFAAMLIHLQSSKGYKQEVDLFIAQAVLQALCLKKDKLASEIFVAYTKVHPEILNTTGPPYKTKLLDAIHFLLISVQE